MAAMDSAASRIDGHSCSFLHRCHLSLLGYCTMTTSNPAMASANPVKKNISQLAVRGQLSRYACQISCMTVHRPRFSDMTCVLLGHRCRVHMNAIAALPRLTRPCTCSVMLGLRWPFVRKRMPSDTKSRGEDRRSHSLVRRVVWSLCASAVIPGAMETYGARVLRVEIDTVNNIVSHIRVGPTSSCMMSQIMSRLEPVGAPACRSGRAAQVCALLLQMLWTRQVFPFGSFDFRLDPCRSPDSGGWAPQQCSRASMRLTSLW